MIHLAYPLFLAAGAMMLLPAILHLLKRKPDEETLFPSLFFLSNYTAAASRRNNIRKWILLILRLAAVAALALIFAWPYLGAAKLDTKEATVILIDASFSTQAEPVRKWIVKTLAGELGKVTDENPAMIGLVTDKILWTKEFYSDKRVLEAFHLQNSFTMRRSNFREAFVNADAKLGKRNAEKRNIIVISDRQRLPWNDVDFSRKLRYTDNITLLAYPASEKPVFNTAVNSASIRETSLDKATSCTLQCVIANYSDLENTVTLDTRFGNNGNMSERIKLKPAEIRKVDLKIELTSPVAEACGGSVELISENSDADMVKTDNIRYFAYNPAEKSSVVKGRNIRSDAAIFLNTAFTDDNQKSTGTNELNYLAEPVQTSGNDDAIPDLYIAEGAIPNSQEAYTAIRNTLARRGCAVIVYNDSKQMRDLLARFGAETEKRKSPGTYSFEMINFDHPLFKPYRTLRIASWFEILFFDIPVIKAPPGCDIVASFNGGIPAILDIPSGEGHLFVICSELDKKHTTWPATTSFLPFWRELAALSAKTARNAFSYETATTGTHIKNTSELAKLSETGNFTLETASGRIVYSVNHPAAESDTLATFNSISLDAMADKNSGKNAESAESAAKRTSELEQPDTGITVYLTAALLLLLLAESITARRTAL